MIVGSIKYNQEPAPFKRSTSLYDADDDDYGAWMGYPYRQHNEYEKRQEMWKTLRSTFPELGYATGVRVKRRNGAGTEGTITFVAEHCYQAWDFNTKEFHPFTVRWDNDQPGSHAYDYSIDEIEPVILTKEIKDEIISDLPFAL